MKLAAPVLEKKLAKLGLRAPQDLVLHLPHRYEDETRLTPIDAAPPGAPVQVEARVLKAEVKYRPKRQLVVHGEGLVLRFLNFYGSQLRQFQRAADEGQLVRAFGEVRPGFFGAEMVHPRYRIVAPGEPLPQSLTPIYATTAGLSQAQLRKLVLAALEEVILDDTLPAPMRKSFDLAELAPSVRSLHLPAPDAPIAELAERSGPAWRRIKFDELLAQQLSMRMAYRARRAREALPLPSNGPLLKRFLGKLPFLLTRAQGRAMAQILRDLAQPHPMQRLLQGDVGSGKTIVAAIGCLAAIDAGCQAAVMAPTEILAEQHLRKFSEWLVPLGVPIAWLHGGLSSAEKNAVVEEAEGTQAIDRHRHARAVPEEGGLCAPRARGGGRAAPLRRAAAPGTAQEGRRTAGQKGQRRTGASPADDERDADSAHAVDDLLRRPGCVDDRRIAARAPRRRHAPDLRRPARRSAGRASATPVPKASRPTGSAR